MNKSVAISGTKLSLLSGCRKPPAVALRITRAVFALPIRLVFWFAIDVRAGGAGKLVVCVNIIDMYDKTRTRHTWRIELMFCCHAVQPDRCRANAHLTMNHLTISITNDASWLKTERLHEEIVCRLDVFVDQQWNDAFKSGHNVYLPSSEAAMIFSMLALRYSAYRKFTNCVGSSASRW
jgi:hypothetical protein